MKAFVLESPTGPGGLRLTDLPVPAIGPADVLVRAKAISLNPVDGKTSHGKAVYKVIKDDVPVQLGWDVSGEVTQAGADVTSFRVGDEVFGMLNFPRAGRTYAEFVAAPAAQLVRKPASVSHAEAAAASLAALTAWQVLITTANVQPGQRVLIHAAGGGVGHYAVQLAKERGAYVIGTSSAAKRDFVLSLGADEHVDYTQVRFEDVVAPVDVVLESVSSDQLARSLEVLKPGGVLVSLLGGLPPLLVPHAEAKNVAVHSLSVSLNTGDQQAIADRLADGRLRSHVALTLPFAELPEALRQVEGGVNPGKVVVLP